jgi:iron complex outermembrane receptor protein
VLDASGDAIPDADVSLTQNASAVVAHTVTDANGQYELDGLKPGPYTLAASKAGFLQYHQDSLQLTAGQLLSVDVSMSLAAVSQSVTVHGGTLNGATPQPSQQDVFESNQSIRVIDRKQMSMVGPVAGGAQVIATAPGALVTGYGNTGATKNTITINGLNQGWGGYGGYTGGGALTITYDGVPIIDPATSLWPSATLPQAGLIQNTNVTYGPGNPADRWYTNVGGAVEFTPVQPTSKPHADVTATYGSYQQENLGAHASSGLHHGWSTVLGGGAGKGDDFRKAPDGFKNPSKDWAVLGKTLKTTPQGNSFELAGYYAYGGGYRPQVIPLAANPYITITGMGTGGPVYSQRTSGFYSSLPFSSYNKYDVNQLGLIYGRENVRLDDATTVQNLSWYMHIARMHARYTDVYALGARENEYNDPHTDTFGDKLLLTKSLPWNTVIGGAYYIHARYNTRQNFYNPSLGGTKTIVNPGGEVRSGYFAQDDFAVFLQDDIHPIPTLHITPGIRYVGFTTGYSNGVNQDFKFLPGVVLTQKCTLTGTNNSGSIPTPNVTDQGSSCDAIENRSGAEPSVDVTFAARPWLNLYGGFQEALRAPSMGGGGGLFQAVDPASYHLERGTYYQFGAKMHTQGTGFKNNLIFGAAYYHQKFANQEIDTTLANGTTTYDSNGTSNYNGVNIFFDDDPLQGLHLFANANIEAASYSTYITGGLGGTTCNPPSGPIPGCVNYSGIPVAYVPTSTLNAGAFYDIHPTDSLTIEPTASFQFIGSQHLFDNCNTPYYQANNFTCGPPIPSATATMPAYATLNLGAKVPYKHFDATVMVLNVLNKSYNIYEYISAGSYFGTYGQTPALPPQYAATYRTGYPGAPVTAYISVAAHF